MDNPAILLLTCSKSLCERWLEVIRICVDHLLNRSNTAAGIKHISFSLFGPLCHYIG